MLYLKHGTSILGADIKKAITGRFIRMINSNGEKILVKFDKYSNINNVHDNCTYRVSFVGTCPNLTEENTQNTRLWRDCEHVYNDMFGDIMEMTKDIMVN